MPGHMIRLISACDYDYLSPIQIQTQELILLAITA